MLLLDKQAACMAAGGPLRATRAKAPFLPGVVADAGPRVTPRILAPLPALRRCAWPPPASGGRPRRRPQRAAAAPPLCVAMPASGVAVVAVTVSGARPVVIVAVVAVFSAALPTTRTLRSAPFTI